MRYEILPDFIYNCFGTFDASGSFGYHELWALWMRNNISTLLHYANEDFRKLMMTPRPAPSLGPVGPSPQQKYVLYTLTQMITAGRYLVMSWLYVWRVSKYELVTRKL